MSINREGYRQVLNFAGRGDLMGCEVLGRSSQASNAVALDDSSAWVLPLRDLRALRRTVPALDDVLYGTLAVQVQYAGEMAELMSAVAAEVRVARFPLQLSARAANNRHSPQRLLRQSRPAPRCWKADVRDRRLMRPHANSRSMSALLVWRRIEKEVSD